MTDPTPVAKLPEEATSASTIAPRQRLKRLFVVTLGISTGVSLVLVVAIGGLIWYNSMPKSPRPWNVSAIVASYDRVSTEGDNNTFAIAYVLENRSGRDYRLTEASKPTLMVQLEEQKSLSRADEFLRIDLPIFIPSGQRNVIEIHLNYRFKEPSPKNGSREERRAYRKKLEEYMKAEFSNLNGFVLFDDENRYQINFPKGW